MESSNEIPYSAFHEVYIKGEPWCRDEEPSKPSVSNGSLQKEMVSASSDNITVPKNNIAIQSDNEIYVKVEVKEELRWPETLSAEISCKSENPSDSDIVLQNEIKQTDSHSDKTGDVTPEATRLEQESLHRNSHSDSFCISIKSEENNCGNTHFGITNVPQLFNSSQTEFIVGCERNSFDSNIGCCNNLIQDCKKSSNCKMCGKSFRRFPDLKMHCVCHENEKIFTCEICEITFTRALDFTTHKSVHEALRKYKCEICEKGFLRASNLRDHKLTHEEKKYMCEICGKGYNHLQYFKRHMIVHEGIRAYKCEICEKSFFRLSTLNEHKLKHDGVKLHECELCKTRFTRASNLKQHKLIHEGKRPYLCEICKKSFTQASHLKTHKLIHEGKKRYLCEICNQGFTRAAYLKHHKLTHEAT